MDTNYGKYNRVKNKAVSRFAMRVAAIGDDSGDAIVEATVLFPVMSLIFAALVLVSIYLPSKAALQNATQYAATALATEISDTWLFFDESEGSMSYYWETDKERLPNVYAQLFEGHSAAADKGSEIIINTEQKAMNKKSGELTVSCYVDNKIIYKEVVAEASRVYTMPVNLSIIGFPQTLSVSATSAAVVQNADEFIRNIDIAADFAQYVIEKFELQDIGQSIKEFGAEVKSLLGW